MSHWSSDFSLCPKDRVVLLKDPAAGGHGTVAAIWTNEPGWHWLVFDPDRNYLFQRCREHLDMWDDRHINGLQWKELA